MTSRYAALDEYGLRHLPRHLARSGRQQELRDMLCDFQWLQLKLDATDPNTLLDDLAHLPGDPEVAIVQSSIRLSANILAGNTAQLAPQLIGRLLDEKTPHIASLVHSATMNGGGGKPWLRPLKRCLPLRTDALIASSRSNHVDELKGFVFTPDGTKIISWDVDALCAWSSDRLAFLSRQPAPGRVSVQIVASLPDNKRIAYATHDYRNTIWTWDVESGESRELLESPQPVRSLAVSGDLIVGAGGERPPRVWSISARRLLGYLPYDTSSPQTSAAPTASRSTYVLHEESKHLELPQVARIAATPDGTAVMGLASEMGRTWLSRWSLPECRLAYRRVFDIPSASDLVLSPEGAWCFTVGDTNLRMFDASSGELHVVFRGHTGEVVSAATDGLWVYSTSRDGSLRIWDIRDGHCLRTLTNAEVTKLAVSPTGRLIVDRYREFLQLWEKQAPDLMERAEADFPRPIAESILHDIARSPTVGRLGFTSEKTTFARAANDEDLSRCNDPEDDTVLELRDARTGRRVGQIPSEPEVWFWQKRLTVQAGAISGNGGRVAVVKGGSAGGASSIIVESIQSTAGDVLDQTPEDRIKTESRIRLKPVGRLDGATAGATDLAFSEDGRTLVICDRRGTLVLWQPDTGQILRHHPSSPFVCCDVSTDGNLVLAGDLDGFVHLLKLESGAGSVDWPDPEIAGFLACLRAMQKSADSGPAAAEGSHGGDDALHLAEAYHGISLADSESRVLYQFEESIHAQLPIMSKDHSLAVGFMVDNQHVVEIRCAAANLAAIPDAIGRLRSLARLDLHDNSIVSLPESLGDLQALIDLDLRSNQLTALPDSIGRLRRLKKLDVSENQITRCPIPSETWPNSKSSWLPRTK